LLSKLIFPSLFGLFGILILLALGIWQVQRLAWKNKLIGEISRSLTVPPVRIIPNEINSDSQYLSISASGKFLNEELHILHALKPYGPGFKLIKPFMLSNDKTILVDLGFIEEKNKNRNRIFTDKFITGNIFFPNETDFFTPDPNLERNIWFSRNLDTMADYLGTMPMMVVLSISLDDGVIATPLKPNLNNNHLQYAITWFSMALAWGGMSIYLVMRVIKISRHTGGKNAL